jgi:hypothetical protein
VITLGWKTSSCQNHACKDQQEYRNTRANPITLPEFLSASRRDKQERAVERQSGLLSSYDDGWLNCSNWRIGPENDATRPRDAQSLKSACGEK